MTTNNRPAPIDGGLQIDPKIARVLLFYREAVAQSTERACRDLRSLGLSYDEAVRLLVGPAAAYRTPR